MTQPIFYVPPILGFMPYKPRKASRRILGHVREVLKTYSANVPLTLRQVYYRLVATHDEYPKNQAFYQKLSTILARARRAGLIDWAAIRDDGVSEHYCGDGFFSLENFKASVLQAAKSYSHSKWDGQTKQIIVLCEASGMLPQIVDAVGDYPAIVRSCGGMDSVTAKHGLAQLCALRDTVILHVGDFDPSGLSIFHSIYYDVRQMVIDACDIDNIELPKFECKRVTILEEHVVRFGLLTGTIKSGDACKNWYPGINGNPMATCEAEALPPDILQRLVRDAVEAEVDMDAFDEAAGLEDVERRQAISAVADLRFDTFDGDVRCGNCERDSSRVR